VEKRIVIFDLDGTLADIEHRRHLVSDGRHEWDKFYEECVHDKPIVPVIKMTQMCRHFCYHIVIFSGRSEVVRGKTERWLSKNFVEYDELRMRPDKDYTPDDQLKEKWLAEIDKEEILCIFDDRQKVVNMWRRNGLTCFQTAEGNF